MGNCHRCFLFLFVFTSLNILSQKIYAIDLGIAAESFKEGVKRNLGVRAYENLSSDTDKRTVILEMNCTIPFSSLSYVGVKMQGAASCRGGEWQCAMRDKPIDPFDKELNASAPPRPSLFDEYYYCTDGLGPVNTKKYICLNRAPTESSYRQINPNIEFKWDDASSKCSCSLKGVENSSQRCDQAAPKFSDEQIAEADKVNGTGPKPEDTPTTAATTPSGDQTTTQAPPPPPKPTEPTKELVECVKLWISTSESCKSAADSAQKSCDGNDKERKEARQAQAVIDGTKNAYVQSNTGAGAQQQCFVASLISTGTREAVSKMYESCQADIESCNNLCKPEHTKEQQTKCEALVAAPGHEEVDSPNRKLFASATEQTQSNLSKGSQVCSQDAKKKESDLSKMLTNLGTALSDSVKCMCKLSTNGIGGESPNCETFPTVAQCEQNPNGNGCHVYGGISACVVGPSYNAQLCACQSNPKSAGCPGGPNSGNLSNFAGGPNLKDSAGNVVAFGPFSNSGLKGSNFDLSNGSGSDTVLSGLDSSSLVLPSSPNAAGAPSSGGVGQSAAGAEGGNDAESNSKGSNAVSSLFNQAKTFVKKTFGLDANTSKPNGNAKFNDGLDKNGAKKFKPRGLTGDKTSAGLGRANMDIFKMMNMCTSAERCQTNQNNYILGP